MFSLDWGQSKKDDSEESSEESEMSLEQETAEPQRGQVSPKPYQTLRPPALPTLTSILTHLFPHRIRRQSSLFPISCPGNCHLS